jgi:hypothetical protein
MVEQQPSAMFTTEKEAGIHQLRDQIRKINIKIVCTYYQFNQ